MNPLPRKVIGIEQVGDKQINHTAIDFRPLFSLAVWIVFTLAALIVSEVVK